MVMDRKYKKAPNKKHQSTLNRYQLRIGYSTIKMVPHRLRYHLATHVDRISAVRNYYYFFGFGSIWVPNPNLTSAAFFCCLPTLLRGRWG